MSKQVLSIEQMQHLEELGVDTSKASMVLLYTDDEGEIIEWEDADEFPGKFVELYDAETGNYDHSYRKYCGVFTLQDILDLLPNLIQSQDEENNYWLEFGTAMEDEEWWYIRYMSVYGVKLNYEEHVHLIDAAYEMLCWCIVNGYVETKK